MNGPFTTIKACAAHVGVVVLKRIHILVQDLLIYYVRIVKHKDDPFNTVST